MLEPPEAWSGGFEAQTDFGSAALLFAEEHDSAVLFFAVGDVPQDEFLAQADRRRQSNETTVSIQYDGARGIHEWRLVFGLALHDDGQLGIHALGAAQVRATLRGSGRLVHRTILALVEAGRHTIVGHLDFLIIG